MSYQAVAWALDEAPVTDITRTLVLVALAEKADERGREARPSIETIARRARVGLRAAGGHLRALRDDGIIVAREKRGPGGVVVYDLAMDGAPARPASPDRHGDAGADRHGDAGHSGMGMPINHPVSPGEPPGTTHPRRSATAADLDARGDAITKAWWESFTPRPSGSFVGFRKIIRSLLNAGWDDDAVLAAARSCGTTFHRAAIESALRRGAGRSAHGVGYRNTADVGGGAVTVDEWRRHGAG